MYKLISYFGEEPKTVRRFSADNLLQWVDIPFATANTDYQTFKAQINADEAQLENADGVLMSPDEAKAFVATLP